MEKFTWRDITPKEVYLSRRKLLVGASAALAVPLRGGTKIGGLVKSPFSTTEEQTPYQDITTYNNFYEFGTQKNEPAQRAKNFRTRPWTVTVEGACAKPRTFDLDEVLKLAPAEERIYRLRCVEGWSMVIPWAGYSLSALLKQVEPLSKAKYVAFQSLYDPKQMLDPRWAGIPFPYVEGLRMDEAMHPLTTLVSGLYGELLPNQNGAPLRLVVPWKYGFKSIKSIVKIRLVEKQPPATWNISNSREYGFYSNVNPEVDHPRWSQASERRIGDFFKRKTLKFNGYDQVANLYAGMDLRKYY
jgi:sulfoxide reductase catalytic subunit YedY